MENKPENNFGYRWTVIVKHTDLKGHNNNVVTGWFANRDEAEVHMKLLRKALNYHDIVKEASK